MCYGRSAETVRMRNKPIGSGFKIWSICDAGYTFYAFPHSNRQPWRYTSNYKSELPHSSAVVARLVDELPRKFVHSDRKLMYIVYMDNLFSSIKLFRMLRDADIGAFGTIRSNSSGFPKSLAIRGTNFNLQWDAMGAVLCSDEKVLALTWIDNGAVQMITTVHTCAADDKVNRKRKRPRLTSTNGA